MPEPKNPAPIEEQPAAAEVARDETAGAEVEAGQASPEDSATGQALDPTAIRMETKALTVDELARRMAEGGIDLAGSGEPAAPWDAAARSRVVESLLLRLPLPAFYFDASAPEHWLVIDGRNRLAALDAYVNGGSLGLTALEFLDHLEGQAFEALPRHFQRRILETKATCHLIQEGTPGPVRDALVRRLDSGG